MEVHGPPASLSSAPAELTAPSACPWYCLLCPESAAASRYDSPDLPIGATNK